MSVNSRDGVFDDTFRRFWRAGTRAMLLTSLLFCSAVFCSTQDVTITEFAVPTPPSGPLGITVGPDGALWFTEASCKGISEIGRITTAGVITEFPVSCQADQITAGPDGALWFTKGYVNQIGRMTTSGEYTEYTLPHAASYNESYPVGIAAGPDGALWFAELFGNRIGRITTSGSITEYSLPHPDSGPNHITLGSDDALWFTESFGNRIGRITTDGVITEYPLPMNAGYPIGITSGPDGRIWFVDYIGNSIGAITTDGVISEYPVPISVSVWPNLLLIAPGRDGALWFTEIDANMIGRITTAGVVTQYPVPTPNSGPAQITLGPDGAMWFTEGWADKIGRIVIRDTTPPLITVSATPTKLRPPNGQMVPVTVWGTITDAGTGLVASSVEYAVTDEYRLVQPAGHMTLDASGNYLFTILVRASHEPDDPNGRRYTIRVSARDNAGNRGAKWQAVTVP